MNKFDKICEDILTEADKREKFNHSEMEKQIRKMADDNTITYDDTPDEEPIFISTFDDDELIEYTVDDKLNVWKHGEMSRPIKIGKIK